MKVKGLLIVSLLLAAAMAAFAFYTAGLLPEGAQLPVHFDGAGHADRFDEPLRALLMPPGILLVISLVLAATPFLDPLQEKLEGSAPLLRVAWLGIMAILAFVQLTAAAPAFGWDLPPTLFHAVIGLFFIALGNMLPKSRPGFFVGIRTPWAITDTDNWIATHRLGGKLFMAAGAMLVALPFLPLADGARVGLTIGAIFAAALVPFGYSWWFWRAKKRQRAAEG